ncbi:MAG: hypothetical protein H8E57_08830 [Candidatus Cloacimonetes bacterium]|nr:hypothetical protein [Candidatus Cloacimonadota bacterium]
MFKKNPIFRWASCIFILGLILFAITKRQSILLSFIVLAYLLRPTLASFGIAKKYVDERQMSLNYRSGNIAFFVMMFACIFFAAKLEAENNPIGEMFYLVIVIGIAAKALFNVLLYKNFREIAPKIIISVGLLIALFSGLESIRNGIFTVSFIMNILPGLYLITIGIVSKYFPRPAAIAILITTILLIAFIFRRDLSWATGGTALIIGFPLLAAAFGLWREPKRISEEVVE